MGTDFSSPHSLSAVYTALERAAARQTVQQERGRQKERSREEKRKGEEMERETERQRETKKGVCILIITLIVLIITICIPLFNTCYKVLHIIKS